MNDETVHKDNEHIHVMPIPVLVGVWLGLIILTVLTVGASHVDLGRFNIWIALGIATVKASLVALYFMHLKYEKPILMVIFLGTLMFVFLFIGLTIVDTAEYDPSMIKDYAPALNKE